MIRFWLVLLLLCLHSAACGQQIAARNAVAFPRFTQKPGRLDADGLPVSGAKVSILGRPNICYQMPSDTASDSSKDTFDFGLDPRTERLSVPGGGSWIFFSSTSSGGGSGEEERLAVLRYEPRGSGGRIVNLLPFVTTTDVTARLMWHLPDVSPYPLLVVTDFIWGVGEGHYGAHFYTLDVWAYSPQRDRYIRVVSYRTAKKYGEDDGMETGAVITAERQNILRRLRANRALAPVNNVL